MHRRQFITAATTGLSLAGLPPRTYAGNDPYRALVCVFLLGGNDSFNTVIPNSDAGYATYSGRRSFLAVPRKQLLPIQASTQADPSFGFHPAAALLHSLYQQQRLAVVANIGPLLFPTSAADFASGTVPLPPQLFSHSDQQDQWQTAVPDDLSAVGWGGRLASALQSGPLGLNVGGALPVNLSLSGSNRLQSGVQSREYAINPDGPVGLASVGGPAGSVREQMLGQVFGSAGDGLLGQAYRDIYGRARQFEQSLSQALAVTPAPAVGFPASRLGQSLQMISRVIAARTMLGATRQVFYVGVGGWDTHDNQINDHPFLLTSLSESLSAFDAALQQGGDGQQVTTLVMSEFGRQLNPNGDGTDHGWGGHAMVMGGAVAGRQVYGQMPDLASGSQDDTGFGSIIPTLPSERLLADLALWMGVEPAQLPTVFPNLDRFALPPLGLI